MAQDTITIEREVEVEKTVTETDTIEDDVQVTYCDECGDEVSVNDNEEYNEKVVNPVVDTDILNDLSKNTLYRLRSKGQEEDVDEENLPEPSSENEYHPEDALQALRGAIPNEIDISHDGHNKHLCDTCVDSDQTKTDQHKSIDELSEQKTKKDKFYKDLGTSILMSLSVTTVVGFLITVSSSIQTYNVLPYVAIIVLFMSIETFSD